MRILSIAAATVAFSLATAASAGAAESGNLSSCVKLAGEVNQALANNAQSPSYDAAKQEKSYGRDFCANGFYERGVTHYAQALKLLGAKESSAS